MPDIYGTIINNTQYDFIDETKVTYDLFKDTVGFTRKNLIPYPYITKTKTTNGITFTDNGDGSVTANGTATSLANFGLIAGENARTLLMKYQGVPLILSGCPTGGSMTTYSFMVQSAVRDGIGLHDLGDGLTFTPVDISSFVETIQIC